MLRVKTYVAQSSIHGLGLFAAEAIPKGTVIWQFDPSIDLVIDLRYMKPGNEVGRQFVLRYGYQTVPDLPVFVLCIDDARFMNHSDEPNADDLEEHTVARRDIAAGEEIVSNYAAFDQRYRSAEPLWADADRE